MPDEDSLFALADLYKIFGDSTRLRILYVLYETELCVCDIAELCGMTVNALRIYALSFLVCGFNIFGSAFFTGLNNGTASALISFLRTLVIQVAAVLLLPRILGIDGIWLAITAAEALTLLVTAALFLTGRKKYHYA